MKECLELPETKERSIGSSLNIRLINSVLVFAFLIIASFTVIQVRGEMAATTRQNRYLAKLSASIVAEDIRRVVERTVGRTDAELKQELARSAERLVATRIAQEICAMDAEGAVIAQAAEKGRDPSPSLQDIERAQSIIDLSEKPNESYTFLDRPHGTLDTFIPVTLGGKIRYVLKTSYSLGTLSEATRNVYIPIVITVILIIILSAANAMSLSARIVRPIKVLNAASKKIALGDLSLQVQIETNDEIEELAHTFNDMTRQLKRMKEIAENANPLTKLPGNNVIHEEIDKRIAAGLKFVVIHSDLDNFKVYNDAYGIGAGDEAIKLTAELFKEAIRLHGGPQEFIGHEGGDDFVLLATPEHLKALTAHFLGEFDKRSKTLYSPEDRERGYILGKERRLSTREGDEEEREQEIKKFPLMSISLAALSNEERPFSSYADITNRMVDIKKRAKRTAGSCLILVKV